MAKSNKKVIEEWKAIIDGEDKQKDFPSMEDLGLVGEDLKNDYEVVHPQQQ